jgi:Peptidase A4 family
MPSRMKHLVVCLVGVIVLGGVLSGFVNPHAAHASSVPPSSSCQQPDHIRDPQTLSASERKAQGYLPQMNGRDTSALDRTYRQHGTHICTTTPTQFKNLGADFEQDNPQWDGNVAYQRDSSNGLYPGVYGIWEVSCLPKGTNDDYSTWVGLGGVNNSNLVQAGVHGFNRGSGPHYNAWVENLADPNNSNEQDVFPVNCGDTITAEIDAPNSFFISDTQTGDTYSQSFGPAANETTAECIVERPIVGGGLAYGLSNFGTETFDVCQVESTGWGYFDGMGHAYHFFFNLVSRDGTHQLAYTGPLTNDSQGTYSVHWKAYN